MAGVAGVLLDHVDDVAARVPVSSMTGVMSTGRVASMVVMTVTLGRVPDVRLPIHRRVGSS